MTTDQDRSKIYAPTLRRDLRQPSYSATNQDRIESTRRQFLGSVGFLSVVAASGLSPSHLAAGEAPFNNRVVPLKMDISPDICVAGGVLLDALAGKFLTFKAVSLDKAGQVFEAGTAVIELTDCRATRFRYPGGEPLADDGFLTYTLVPCQAYEVEDSSWLKQVNPKPPSGKREIRHFVFTFVSTSFECLASDLIIDVWEKPFAEIVASLYPPNQGP